MVILADLNMQDLEETTLDLRDKLGWVLLGVVMITVGTNLVRAMLKDTKLVLSYLRKKHRKCLRKAKKDIGSRK
jgi:hypothetical protein